MELQRWSCAGGKGRKGREMGAVQGRSWGRLWVQERRQEREGAGVSSHRPSCPEDCVRRLKREEEQVEQVGQVSGPDSEGRRPTRPRSEMPPSAHLYRGCSDVSEGDRSGMDREVEDSVVAMEAVVASSKEGGVQGRRSGRPAGMRQWVPSGARPQGCPEGFLVLHSSHWSPTLCSPHNIGF